MTGQVRWFNYIESDENEISRYLIGEPGDQQTSCRWQDGLCNPVV